MTRQRPADVPVADFWYAASTYYYCTFFPVTTDANVVHTFTAYHRDVTHYWRFCLVA